MIQKLKGRLVEIENQMTAINADAAERLLTADEKTTLSNLQSEHTELNSDLKLRENISAQIEMSSKPQPVVGRPARSFVQTSPAFSSLGDFLLDVVYAASGPASDRLLNSVASAGNEGTPGAGGFAVPADLRRDIQARILSEDSLLSKVDRVPTFSKVLTFPVDVTDPWDTTYGAADIHIAEMGPYTEVTPSLSSTTVTVGKMGVAVSVTEELMDDALAMGAFVSRKLGERLNDRINFDIISGTSPNGCVGFFQGGNLKVVLTGAENATARLSADNLLNMYYSMPTSQRATGVWLVSPSLEPYVAVVKLSGSSMYSRPGDFAGNITNTATILGRPVMVMPQMAAVGTQGDIAFASLSQYLMAVKGDVSTDVTPYVYWLNDAQTFKTSIRLGGKPWRSTPYTMGDGTTRASFVTLAGNR